jgi:hypothetical protein
MIFTHKSIASSQLNQSNDQNRIYRDTKVTPIYRRSALPAPTPKKAVVVEEPRKKMLWGEPTWYFFHTIAHKIKPEHFPTLRLELLNMVASVCNNLPCPNCASHATQYMKNVNFNAIQSKDQLKMLFYNFHNSVNARKGYALFPLSELDAKYENANLIAVIQKFMYYFEEKHRGMRLVVHQMHRDRVTVNIKQWLITHLDKFDV